MQIGNRSWPRQLRNKMRIDVGAQMTCYLADTVLQHNPSMTHNRPWLPSSVLRSRRAGAHLQGNQFRSQAWLRPLPSMLSLAQTTDRYSTNVMETYHNGSGRPQFVRLFAARCQSADSQHRRVRRGVQGAERPVGLGHACSKRICFCGRCASSRHGLCLWDFSQARHACTTKEEGAVSQ